jgi:long-chain fatty acid transport protein
VDLFQPWQIVLGGALRLPFYERLLVSLDLTFARWSEMPAPAATFELALDIGRLNDFVKLRPSEPYPPPGFHDLLIPAIGLEWRALPGRWKGRLDLDLRAGYRYEASPAPQQSGDSTFGDADKHILSAGAGLTLLPTFQVLPGPVSLDVFFAFTHLPERRNYKADPRSPVGDFTVGGAVVQGGAQLRWQL